LTTKKKEVARECFLRTRPTFRLSQSLMVYVDISKLGCTDLVFVDPGVKINGAYYRDVLLSKQLLPVMRKVSGIFRLSKGQYPSTPARDTVQLVLCCYRIFGQQIALTLIRVITGSGA